MWSPELEVVRKLFGQDDANLARMDCIGRKKVWEAMPDLETALVIVYGRSLECGVDPGKFGALENAIRVAEPVLVPVAHLLQRLLHITAPPLLAPDWVEEMRNQVPYAVLGVDGAGGVGGEEEGQEEAGATGPHRVASPSHTRRTRPATQRR